jgi:hypothetical protein
MTHTYFCEATVERLADWERELLDTSAHSVQIECDRPATRLITTFTHDFHKGMQEDDAYFLCSKHTLEWLDADWPGAAPGYVIKNRKTMHTIESLQYPNAAVASWIGPNGEDGTIPPIGITKEPTL